MVDRNVTLVKRIIIIILLLLLTFIKQNVKPISMYGTSGKRLEKDICTHRYSYIDTHNKYMKYGLFMDSTYV